MEDIPYIEPSANSPQPVQPRGTSRARPTYCLFCYKIYFGDDSTSRFFGHIGLDFDAHVDGQHHTHPRIITAGQDPDIVKGMDPDVQEHLKGTNMIRVPKRGPEEPERVIVYKTLPEPTGSAELCFLVEPYATPGQGLGPCPPVTSVLISLEHMPTDYVPGPKKTDSNGDLRSDYDPRVPNSWIPRPWRDGTRPPEQPDPPEEDKYAHRRRLAGPTFR
jgi:hypothetical protein